VEKHCRQLAARRLDPIINYAREMAARPGISEVRRAQINQMIGMLQEIRQTFTGQINAFVFDHHVRPTNQRFELAAFFLALWDDDLTALEFWEAQLAIADADRVAFRELVSVPLLLGQAGWTDQQLPLPLDFLRRKIADRKREEARARARQRQREEDIDAIDAMDTAAEQTSAADLSSIRELLLANTKGDVRRYGEQVFDNVRAFGSRRLHQEIRQQLHWSRQRARRAKRGWEAHLYRAAGRLPVREALGRLSADASRTVIWRTFFDPAGRLRGYWEHKP
jgi:hypothetical protein